MDSEHVKSLIHSYSIEYKKGEDCKLVSFCSELWSCRQLRHINIFCFYGKDRIHPFLFMTIETSRGLIPYTENSSLGNFYPSLNANGEQPAFFLKYFPKSEGLAKDRISDI